MNNEINKVVSKKPFILSVESNTYTCVQTHVLPLTRGIASEMYMMVYVDRSTLHLPFKIKNNVENKNQICTNTNIQSKTKINLKISIAVKGQIHVNLSKLK